MTNEDAKISASEAQAALDVLNKTSKAGIAAQRPPMWYLVLNSVADAIMVFSYASMRHENLWALGMIASIVVMVLLFLFLVYSYRLMGIKLKKVPSSKAGWQLLLKGVAFFALLFAGSRELSVAGFEWAAYVGAVLSGVGLYYASYKYPTFEPVSKEASK